MHIGKLLKQYRVERDWTLQYLSELTSITIATLSRIENQQVKPNDRTVYKLRKALPVIDEALKKEEDTPRSRVGFSPIPLVPTLPEVQSKACSVLNLY